MKIKTGNSSIKLKMLLVFCVPVFAVSLVIRCIEIATAIDASTGFYIERGFLAGFFDALIIISCVLIAVCAFLSSESAKIKTTGISSKPLFAVTLVFALSLFLDCFRSLIRSFSSLSTAAEGSAFKGLMVSGTLPFFIESVFALFSGVYFIYAASSFKSGKDTAAKHRILALMPVGWVAFRMVGLFVRKISFTKVSDLFFELIMLGFMIMFFMAFAQITSNVYSEGFSWRIFGFGLPAGLIAAVLNLSRLIFSIINSSEYINPNHPFNVTDILFAAFIFTMCVMILKKKPAQDEQREITDGCE